MQTKTYAAVIPTASGVDFHVNTSQYVSADYQGLIVYCGPFSFGLDVAAARALGSHLIAAADHYQQQVDALEILRRVDEATEA